MCHLIFKVLMMCCQCEYWILKQHIGHNGVMNRTVRGPVLNPEGSHMNRSNDKTPTNVTSAGAEIFVCLCPLTWFWSQCLHEWSGTWR